AGSAFMWLFVRAPGEPHMRGWPVIAAGVSSALAGLAAPLLPFSVVNPWLLASAALLLAGGLLLALSRAARGDGKARIVLAPLLLAILPGIVLVALDRLLGV